MSQNLRFCEKDVIVLEKYKKATINDIYQKKHLKLKMIDKRVGESSARRTLFIYLSF